MFLPPRLGLRPFLCEAQFIPRRRYATDNKALKLVVELRKQIDVSVSKAKEALSANGNDIQKAIQWVANDTVATGQKQAAKVAGRAARDGLVSIGFRSPGLSAESPASAALVELNCETDFVARSSLFQQLASDIANTAACAYQELNPYHPKNHSPKQLGHFFRHIPLESLQSHKLVPSGTLQLSSLTVSDSIRDVIGKVKENVSLRRAVVTAPGETNVRIFGHCHGSLASSDNGRIGSLVLSSIGSVESGGKLILNEELLTDLQKFEKSIARQIVGFETLSIGQERDVENETVLYEQEYMMSSDPITVRQAIHDFERKWNLTESAYHILDFSKWTVGESWSHSTAES